MCVCGRSVVVEDRSKGWLYELLLKISCLVYKNKSIKLHFNRDVANTKVTITTPVGNTKKMLFK